MVQTTKWNNTDLADTRLNEQTIFWGTSNPASGLPTNSWFFNTTDGTLYQNTGTEGSPIWTVRNQSGTTTSASDNITIAGRTETLGTWIKVGL